MGELKTKKSKPRWWTPYWILLVVFTIIIGVVIPFFLNPNFERGVFGTIMTLLVLCFGYYIRVKPLSIRSNRISIYIFGFGSVFGGIIWMFLLGIGVVRWMIYVMGPNENIGIGLSIVVSFGIGAILGDLIGKYRNYKGPAQYAP